jgi:hypothetical protein
MSTPADGPSLVQSTIVLFSPDTMSGNWFNSGQQSEVSEGFVDHSGQIVML